VEPASDPGCCAIVLSVREAAAGRPHSDRGVLRATWCEPLARFPPHARGSRARWRGRQIDRLRAEADISAPGVASGDRKRIGRTLRARVRGQIELAAPCDLTRHAFGTLPPCSRDEPDEAVNYVVTCGARQWPSPWVFGQATALGEAMHGLRLKPRTVAQTGGSSHLSQASTRGWIASASQYHGACYRPARASRRASAPRRRLPSKHGNRDPADRLTTVASSP
jgi:hypothetical protein